jgi:hypothetical protein
VYYTAGDSNPPTASQPIQAQIDEKLIYPIIKDASQFQVGLVKSKVPLDTIPLTKSNIPLKAYDITLRKGEAEGSAYVEQVNARENQNFLWKSYEGTISQFTYTKTGTVSSTGVAVNYSQYIPFINQFVVDDFSHIYAIGSTEQGGISTLFGVFSFQASPVVFYQESFANINCICIDRTTRVFLGAENVDGNDGVYVYQSTPTQTTTTLQLVETITADFNDNPLTDVISVCADINIVVGYDTNKVQIYSSDYIPISSSITLPQDFVQLGTTSAILHDQDTFCLVDEGENIDVIVGIDPTGSCFNVANGNLYFQGTWAQTSCPRLQTSQQLAIGVGVSPGSLIYSVPNNYTSDPTIIGSDNYSITCSDPFNNWYAKGSNGSTLYNIIQSFVGTFNINPMASDFQVSSTNALIGIDSNKSSNLLYGVGAQDAKLYVSNQPVVPIHLFTSPILEGALAGRAFQRNDYAMPVNVDQMTYTTQYQAFNNDVSVANFKLLGLYQTTVTGAVGYIACGVNYNFAETPNSTRVKLWSLDANFNETAFTPTIIPSGSDFQNSPWGYSSPPIAFFPLSTGLNSVLGIMTTKGQCVFYDALDFSALPHMTLQIQASPIGMNFGYAICSVGSNIYYADKNSITGLYFNPNDNVWTTLYPFAELYLSDGSPFFPQSMWIDPADVTRIFCVGTAGDITKLQLFVIKLTDQGGITTAVVSGPYVNPNEPEPFIDYTVAQKFAFSAPSPQEDLLGGDAYNLISGSSTQKVICIPNPASNGFDFFSYVLGSNFQMSYANSTLNNYQKALTNTIPFVFNIDFTSDGMYTYNTNVPTNLDSSLTSICFSLKHTSTCYATNSSGEIFKGTLVNGSIQNFTQVPVYNDDTFQSISVADLQVADSTIYCYRLSNQNLVNTYPLGLVSVLGLSPNTFTGNYTCCTDDTSGNLINFDGNTLLPTNFTTTITNPGCIYTKNSEDVDAGPADIFTYQVLIDAINRAFALAFKRANINQAGLINAPTVSMDFQTGLCTLNYDSEYTNSVNGVSYSTDGIIFNTNLYNLLRFYGQKDTSQYATPGDYLLLLSTGSGTGPFSALQTSKSITTFNRLDKILFQSNSIYVAQSYFGNNQVNQVITDIDVDTSSLVEMEGQWLLYQPNFIRPFILASNNAIDRIQLSVYYSYIDGTSYPLFINPGSGWNVKLDFFRKFGF